MTNEPVQGHAVADGAHARGAGAGLCETGPVLSSVRRRGSVAVVGAGPGGSARVAPAAERGHGASQVRHATEPVFSLARRRGCVVVVGAGPGGSARVASAAERGHDAPIGQTVGDKRRATLRCGTASLSETVGRAPFEQCGRRAGEGAR
ncbi:DUF6380 family protein [Streptomyces coeruleorubidus]|uniref:DUF6380 family protein n=1 Tax=Streptomyces coeruleorubidus TaxID=116188 RepID=UPI0033A6A1D8